MGAHNCVKHFWKKYKKKMKRLLLQAQVTASSYPEELRRVTLLHLENSFAFDRRRLTAVRSRPRLGALSSTSTGPGVEA
jgi:hypothetical protein